MNKNIATNSLCFFNELHYIRSKPRERLTIICYAVNIYKSHNSPIMALDIYDFSLYPVGF